MSTWKRVSQFIERIVFINMKLLVLGANGMAGHMITLYFLEKGYEVTGFSRQDSLLWNTITGDANNIDQLTEILLENEYDYVINCIGVLNQFAQERISNAIYLNSYLPHIITEIIKDKKTRLIHMSTDCVFAGNTGPYTENSLCDGTTVYDKTKALGEIEDNKNVTFRMSIIGPDVKDNGIGLFHWFMKQQTELLGYTNAIWTGVTTLTLARAMEQAMKEKLTGLYHLVNNMVISKYELCQLFNYYFRDNKLLIKPFPDKKLDKTLINTRSDFTFVVPGYEQMIQEMKEWIYYHKSLYPVYYFN